MLSPQAEAFTTNKLIFIVRNPLDVIARICELTQTGSAHLKIKEKMSDFPEFWNTFIKERVKELRQYFNVMLEETKNEKVPIYFVRFEELLEEPNKVLSGLFSFILGVEEDTI